MRVTENGREFWFVNYSTLSTFKSCKELARLSFKERLEQKKENLAFTFGSAFHAAVALHTVGAPLNEAILGFVNYLTSHESTMPLDIEGLDKRSVDRGVALVEGYYKKWESEPYKVHRTAEGEPFTEISFRLYMGEFDSLPIILGGTIDAIVEHVVTGALYIKETKTTGMALSTFMQKTKPNSQISIYDYACHELLKLKPSGVIWDCIFISDRRPNPKGQDPFERLGIKLDADYGRITTTRNEVDREELVKDLHYDIEDYLNWFSSDVKRWPRSTGRCHDYGGCQFLDVCISNANPQVIEGLYRKNEWEPWKSPNERTHNNRSVERRMRSV